MSRGASYPTLPISAGQGSGGWESAGVWEDTQGPSEPVLTAALSHEGEVSEGPAGPARCVRCALPPLHVSHHQLTRIMAAISR